MERVAPFGASRFSRSPAEVARAVAAREPDMKVACRGTRSTGHFVLSDFRAKTPQVAKTNVLLATATGGRRTAKIVIFPADTLMVALTDSPDKRRLRRESNNQTPSARWHRTAD